MPRKALVATAAVVLSSLLLCAAALVAARGRPSARSVESLGKSEERAISATAAPRATQSKPESPRARSPSGPGGATTGDVAPAGAPSRESRGEGDDSPRDYASLRSYEEATSLGLAKAADSLRESLDTMREEKQSAEAMETVLRRIDELDGQSQEHAARSREYAALAAASLGTRQ
jgi:hypothetical protein